jgi:P27 family predicted phage terminase small subunit
MGRPRGNKPAPTQLKLIKGTRDSRINKSEAHISASGMPEPPEHLSPEARIEWDRVCPDLYKAGLLTKVDRAILGAYCSAYGRWQLAEMALATYRTKREREGDLYHGIVLGTTHGNTVQNPMVGAVRTALLDMSRYCTDLGMTPSSRGRVTAAPPAPESEDPADRYFS